MFTLKHVVVITVVCGLNILYYFEGSRRTVRKEIIKCSAIIEGAGNYSPVLLWDPVLVSKVVDDDYCNPTEKLQNMAILSKRDPLPSSFDAVMHYEDQENTNFFLIHDFVKRGIHKRIWKKMGNILIPRSLQEFKGLWDRSTMLSCLNLTMHRNETKRHEWSEEKTLKNMEKLVFLFLDYKMHIYIQDGTLLGWFRECSFIPHTTDVDFGFLWTEYNPSVWRTITLKKTIFKPVYRWGFHKVDLEYSVYPHGKEPKFDIFETNFDGKTTYVSSFDKAKRYKYAHNQVLDPYCSANLKGYLFWIPCSPREILESCYGDWMSDKPKFDYTKDTVNGVFVHKYKESDNYLTIY